MVFLDTCIWIELCGVKSPSSDQDALQAQKASNLMKDILNKDEKIISCKEQLIEIALVIQKIKLKEYNRLAKSSGNKGCSDIKSFRGKSVEFQITKALCLNVIEDVNHFADLENYDYTIGMLLKSIDVADINDCIYFNLCKDKGAKLYTFDKDFINWGQNSNVTIL